MKMHMHRPTSDRQQTNLWNGPQNWNFNRIPRMILNIQGNWKTTFSYVNKPQSIFKYEHLLLSTTNTSPAWTSCAPFVHKTLIFSHFLAFDYAMPFICPSPIFPDSESQLKCALLREAFSITSSQMWIFWPPCCPIPSFVPFTASPPSAFCCNYLYTYMLYLPVTNMFTQVMSGMYTSYHLTHCLVLDVQ